MWTISYQAIFDKHTGKATANLWSYLDKRTCGRFWSKVLLFFFRFWGVQLIVLIEYVIPTTLLATAGLRFRT
jgi:hypothetical protein